MAIPEPAVNPFRYKDWTNNDLFLHRITRPVDNNYHLPIREDIQMTFDQWLKIGLAEGWCGPAVCYTHDGLPMSDAEADQFEENDPCLHIIRLYENEQQRSDIERDHAPSQWRKPRD